MFQESVGDPGTREPPVWNDRQGVSDRCNDKTQPVQNRQRQRGQRPSQRLNTLKPLPAPSGIKPGDHFTPRAHAPGNARDTKSGIREVVKNAETVGEIELALSDGEMV